MKHFNPSPVYERCFTPKSFLYRLTIDPKYLAEKRVQIWLSTQQIFFELLEPFGKHAFYPSEFGEKGVYFFETCLHGDLLMETLYIFGEIAKVERLQDINPYQFKCTMQQIEGIFNSSNLVHD